MVENVRHAFTFLIYHTNRKAYFLLFSAISIKAFFENLFFIIIYFILIFGGIGEFYYVKIFKIPIQVPNLKISHCNHQLMQNGTNIDLKQTKNNPSSRTYKKLDRNFHTEFFVIPTLTDRWHQFLLKVTQKNFCMAVSEYSLKFD
jgi:hypothetical protein